MTLAAVVACGGDHGPLHADLPPQPSSQPPPVARHQKRVWIARDLSTGMVMRRSTLTIRTLTLDGERATLAVAVRTTTDKVDAPWSDGTTRTYTGRGLERVDGHLDLALHDAADTLALSCVYKDVSVAADTAVRVRSSDSECGDVGQWSPSATTMMHAWVCAPDGDDKREEIAFGQAPGIEHLFVNDDCIIQGGGLRRVPRDGSVAAVRGQR